MQNNYEYVGTYCFYSVGFYILAKFEKGYNGDILLVLFVRLCEFVIQTTSTGFIKSFIELHMNDPVICCSV